MLSSPRLPWLFQTTTLNIIQPAVIDAPQPSILNAPITQVRAPVRTVEAQESRTPLIVAEKHKLLAQQLHR
jgi:hypothetical protein